MAFGQIANPNTLMTGSSFQQNIIRDIVKKRR